MAAERGSSGLRSAGSSSRNESSKSVRGGVPSGTTIWIAPLSLAGAASCVRRTAERSRLALPSRPRLERE